MSKFIHRRLSATIEQYRKIFPAVAVLGPRQCGKSTLVKFLSQSWPDTLYIDLQNPEDAARVKEPMLFLESNADKVICLDEIHLLPELFSLLRSAIDNNRTNGKYILLGSASRDLIQKSSESLAGRIGFINLAPFTIDELTHESSFDIHSFWLRGGYPESYLSDGDDSSDIWRENFIRTYVERDIPQLGIQIPSTQLRRFLTMCAHINGQVLNLSKLAESLSLTHPTIRRYVGLLEQTFILRTLQPYEPNTKKRLVKSPKLYVRDSGILHRLLQIRDFNALLGHPVFGPSWEGMVIENILENTPDWQAYFFRTATGNELDLILEKGSRRIAVECKASKAPKVAKGFYDAVEIVKPDETFLIAPITGDGYKVNEQLTVCSLNEFIEKIKTL